MIAYRFWEEIVLDGSGDRGEGRDCLRWEGYAAKVFSFGFPCVWVFNFFWDCLRWEGYAARVFSFGFPCVWVFNLIFF